MPINIVLVRPEIPQNTGNIARTAAATSSVLHLVKPLGFELSDKHLKRAGLDYWHDLDIRIYDNLDDFFSKNAGGNYYFISTKAKKTYAGITYKDGDYLLFGSETKGLPERLLRQNYANTLRLPMAAGARSLNLSNAVAVVVYEALRQQSFENLQLYGQIPPTKPTV